jgi:alpha-beta hydrolase superfamily lysophospholipase
MAIPLLPGVLLLLAGVSLLSMGSAQAHYHLARMRVKYPKLANDIKRLESALVDTLQIGTHTHTYITIPSQNKEGLRALLEISKFQTGVAILLHSVSGTVETAVSNVLAEGCKARGLTVLRFDARNGLNEHGTHFASFTASNFYTDLEEVLAWARTQPWWHRPLVLVGHSVGGLVALRYAEEHLDAVTQLILLGPTLSGESYVQAFSASDPTGLKQWQETRLRTVKHPLSQEGYGLSYGFVEDLMQYDVAKQAHTITIPTLILSGTDDVTTTPTSCKALADALGPQAKLVPLEGVPHTPATRSELHTLQEILRTHDF